MRRIGLAAGAIAGVTLAGVLAYYGTKLFKREPAPGNAPGAPAAAGTEAEVLDKVARIVHWQVKYHDEVLGDVNGHAMVDWDQRRATVSFEQPKSAGGATAKAVLTADNVTLDATGTTVDMDLVGASPGGPPVVPARVDGATVMAGAAGQRLTVKEAGSTFSSDVVNRARPDEASVRVTLRAQQFGALVGEWSYYADPITQRNARGTGRVGRYRLLEEEEIGRDVGFLGEQRSYEEWLPLPTEIVAAMVMEDQGATKKSIAVYPYPNFIGSPADEKNRTRTLFVVGRNFPTDRGKMLQGFRFPDEDKVEWYRMAAVSTDPDLDEERKKQLDEAWKKLTQQMQYEEKAAARRELDAAIVVVRVKSGVMPGPKRFEWSGGSASWFLQFGDTLADASFARTVQVKTKDDETSVTVYERTPWVFPPERLWVEVETRVELPIESFPVRLAVRPAGAPAGTAPSGTALTLHARRQPGRNRVYRTDPIDVVYGGTTSATSIAVKPRDRIMAIVNTDDVAFAVPPLADAAVLLTPDQLAQSDKVVADTKSVPDGTTSLTVKLWKEAVVLAARADQKEITDFNKTPSLDPYRGIPMTVADHAAMLLLRSAFLDLMRERRQMLDNMLNNDHWALNGVPQRGPDPDQIDAFREWVRPFLERPAPEKPSKEPPVGWEKYPDYLASIEDANKLKVWVQSLPGQSVKTLLKALDSRRDPDDTFGKGTYFGELSVPNPAGSTGIAGSGGWPFYRTFWEARDVVFDPFFPDSRDLKMREWRQNATRSVIQQYRDAVERTIQTLTETRDSDIKGLLKITGVGFAPVVGYVLPQLMKLDDGGGTMRWVPDMAARAAVANLHTFTDAVRKAEDYSDLKLQSVVSIAGDLLMVHGVFAESVSVLTHIANAGLLLWQIGYEIYDQVLVRLDLDFYFGASAVVGVDQLEEMNARKTDAADFLEGLAGQFAISSVWGALEEPVGPKKLPTVPNGARLRLPFEASVLAADRPNLIPRRIRSFADRIRRSVQLHEIGEFNRMRHEAGLSPLTVSDFRQRFGKAYIQHWLQDCAITAAKIVAREPLAQAEVLGLGEAVRLHAPHEGMPFATAVAAAEGPPPAGPYLPHLGMYAGDLPHVKVPAMTNRAVIAIVERMVEQGKQVARYVYYKTTGVDPLTGRPKKLAKGVSADVSDIAAVRGRDKFIRDSAGRLVDLEKDAVIKIVKDAEDKGFGHAREQILRIKAAYETLVSTAKGRILFPEIFEFHPDAEPPYFIQRKLDFVPGDLEQVDVRNLIRKNKSGKYEMRDWAEVEKWFPRDKRVAVAELYAQVASLGLAAADLSLPNIYFKKAGGRWVAGILDIDHIVRFSEVNMNPKVPAKGPMRITHDWFKDIYKGGAEDIPSTIHDPRWISDNATTLMEKMLEMRWGGNGQLPWIKYDPATRQFLRGLIEPELVEQAFKNTFRKRIPVFTLPKQSRMNLPPLLGVADALAPAA